MEFSHLKQHARESLDHEQDESLRRIRAGVFADLSAPPRRRISGPALAVLIGGIGVGLLMTRPQPEGHALVAQSPPPHPATSPEPREASIIPGDSESTPVVVKKIDGGTLLEWEARPGATYQITRCFIRPGLQACQDVSLAADSHWVDSRPYPPDALTLYRVKQVRVAQRGRGA